MTCDPRQQLRQQLRHARRSLNEAEQQHAAQTLIERLKHSPSFQQAKRIGLYLAADGELRIHQLLSQTLAKDWFLPLVDPQHKGIMVFQQVLHDSQWQNNRYGIREPLWDPNRQTDVNQLDLILMPLVGFDDAGNRLGMGGGYYDRLLAPLQQQRHKPWRIGIAHDCQQVASLPVQSWDVPLHAILSPTYVWIHADCQAQLKLL